MKRIRLGKLLVTAGLVLAIFVVQNPSMANTTRPISEWLNAQGQDPTQWGGSLFVPPDPNYLGWADHTPTLFTLIDYAGLSANYHKLAVQPVINGSVTEKILNGEALVTVILNTQKANAWVMSLLGPDVNFATTPTIFGHRASEVAGGASQALADVSFKLEFINSAPGAALPDAVWLVGIYDQPHSDYIYEEFTASSLGPLTAEFGVPENTLGKLTVHQVGVWDGRSWTYSAEVLTVEVVPLPAAQLLFGSGLLGLLGLRAARRR